MKFTLLALLAAVAVECLPASQGRYEIRDFYAEHTPHSAYSIVSFNVTDHRRGLPSTACEASKTTEYSNTIGSYQKRFCDNGKVAWSLTRDSHRDYVFTVKYEGIEATRVFHGDDQFFESPPHSGFEWEYLHGPHVHNFNMPY